MKRYALCDYDTLAQKNVTLEAYVGLAQKHGAEVIQYRNKHASSQEVKHDLLHLRKIWDGYLIINDHISLVPFCDGLHIGQEDALKYGKDLKSAIKAIRKQIGRDKILGLSTHNKAEVLAANRLDINYIGLGAYRATATKSEAAVLGEALDDIAKLSHYPVAAIGGVLLEDTFDHVAYLVIGSGLYDY